jgi:hypothetical protein
MSQLLLAPNGSLLRAEHIVAVSPVFESPELGCDAFAVYTVGDSSDPFLFCADWCDTESTKKRTAATIRIRDEFVAAWKKAVDPQVLVCNN